MGSPTKAPAEPSCTPFACNGQDIACPSSCAGATDCAPGHFCDRGACIPSTANGAACDRGEQCASGFCADGVCCVEACGGSDPNDCRACAKVAGSITDGACTPVLVTTPVVCRPATGPCDVEELCDGASTQCPPDEMLPEAQCAPGGQGGDGSGSGGTGGATGGAANDALGAADDERGGCSCTVPGRRNPDGSFVWLLAMAACAARRAATSRARV